MPMTTSHESAAKVLRMKPRRWGHQVYVTPARSSPAISWAKWFSSPSPDRLEKGRLLGSEQTRSSCLGCDVLHSPILMCPSCLCGGLLKITTMNLRIVGLALLAAAPVHAQQPQIITGLK